MKNTYCRLVAVLAALTAGGAHASPADYVYTPAVQYGEREIDFKSGTAPQADGTRNQAHSIGFGYGVSQTWFTELYLKRELEGSEKLSLVEWENKFQLTDPGQYAVDVGLITEIEAPLNNSREPYEFKFGPLFQTEAGKMQFNGNLLFERKFGRHQDGDDPYITEFGYQWQVKYRYKREFEFGAQGIGEVGKWDKQDQQVHRVGPAAFGKFLLGGRQVIKYNAAYLVGASAAAPDHTFRMQIEYEF